MRKFNGVREGSVVFLLLIGVVLTSCEEPKDECADCASAINHMAEKIAANGCNPNFMQEAWDRMKTDCGNYRGDLAAGYLAENCTFGYNGGIACTDVATGLLIFDEGKRPIRIKYTNALPNDTLIVVASQFKSYQFGKQQEVLSNQTTTLNYEGSVDFETMIHFAVINGITEDTVASGSKSLNYNRTNQWNVVREVQLFYDQTLQGHLMNFVNW